MCNFTEKLNSFAGIFWLVLAQLQNRFFVEHLPVATYVRCWRKKNERNEIVCFYCTQSDILCGIAKFSRGNKNKLRTFQSQKWKQIKNSQPQTKLTGSYKKRECSFFTYTLGTLLKHVADKNKTFAIILNLDS